MPDAIKPSDNSSFRGQECSMAALKSQTDIFYRPIPTVDRTRAIIKHMKSPSPKLTTFQTARQMRPATPNPSSRRRFNISVEGPVRGKALAKKERTEGEQEKSKRRARWEKRDSRLLFTI